MVVVYEALIRDRMERRGDPKRLGHAGRSRLDLSQRTYVDLLRAKQVAQLGLTSQREFDAVLTDPAHREALKPQAYRSFAAEYGIRGDERMAAQLARDFAYLSNAYITDYLCGRGPLRGVEPTVLEMTEEARTTSDWVDLMALTAHENDQVAIEAGRKLYHIHLRSMAWAAEQQTPDAEEKFHQFDANILNHVLNPLERRSITIRSTHADSDFAPVGLWEVVTGEDVELASNQRLTPLPSRTFTTLRDKEVPIYISARIKSDQAVLGKLDKKRGENIAKEIEDKYGIMFVVPNKRNVRELQDVLVYRSTQHGFPFSVSDVENTLDGKPRKNPSIGGATVVPMLKFIAKQGSLPVEIIILTYDAYLRQRYQDGVAHDEYELIRLRDAANNIFPPFIYGIDLKTHIDETIAKMQAAKRAA